MGEVTEIVREAYDVCKTMLLKNRALLDELTEELVEKETIDYQEMQALVGKYHPNGIGTENLKLPAEAALLWVLSSSRPYHCAPEVGYLLYSGAEQHGTLVCSRALIL